MIDRLHGLADDAAPGIEIDVVPAEAQSLTAPAPGCSEEQPCRVVAFVFDMVQEAAESLLVPSPHLRRGRLAGSRRSRTLRDVARHPVPVHGLAQRTTDDGVDVPDGPP